MRRFLLPIFILVLIITGFFSPFFIKGKLPIPSDTIIGLYHPFRDLYSKDYPNGIPFKNFLITDPVRQQYPWRNLSIEQLKQTQLPLWNPYSMAGTPLLGNWQSAPFYPLNILFFILPFPIAWSFLIYLSLVLGGVFMFFYLWNLKVSKPAAFLGAISFAFCGFFVAWVEWGTLVHVALWLPLLLLAIDKIYSFEKETKNRKYLLLWMFIFLFSLVSSIFAGHSQTIFYTLLVTIAYIAFRLVFFKKNKKILLYFLGLYIFGFLITTIQIIPFIQLLLVSARDIDLNWQKEGWFIPWQHIVQFIVPDFFGNPATGNYWGVWNYGEFIGYIGIVPLFFALSLVFGKKTKEILFFGALVLVSILFAFPTGVSTLPFIFHIPLLSTAQPTRLVFLIDFSLCVLAAFGVDEFLVNKRKLWYPLGFIVVSFIVIGLVVVVGNKFNLNLENLSVAKHNLYLPFGIFIGLIVIVFAMRFIKNNYIKKYGIYLLIGLTIFDLWRFADKFLPFTQKDYLFPQTSAIEFLQEKSDK